MSYSGQLISSLHETVDRAESGVNALQILAHAKAHLASGPFDVGDESAWWQLQVIMDCIFSGLTTPCRHCGRMEGEHSETHGFCPFDSLSYFQPERRSLFR